MLSFSDDSDVGIVIFLTEVSCLYYVGDLSFCWGHFPSGIFDSSSFIFILGSKIYSAMKISVLGFKAFQVLWVWDGMKHIKVSYSASGNSEWFYFESWKYRWELNGWWVKCMCFQMKNWSKNCSLVLWLGDQRPFLSLWQLMFWLIIMEHLHMVCEMWVFALYISSHCWTCAAAVLWSGKWCWACITFAAVLAVGNVLECHEECVDLPTALPASSWAAGVI